MNQQLPSTLACMPYSKLLQATRRLAYIRRCHQFHLTRPASVAEHSYGVQQLVIWARKVLVRVLPALDWDWLLIRASLHDLSEVFTGDIPAPTKWLLPADAMALAEKTLVQKGCLGVKCPGLKSAWSMDFENYLWGDNEGHPQEELLLKYLDILELRLYCEEELALGNPELTGVHAKTKEVMIQLVTEFPPEVQLILKRI